MQTTNKEIFTKKLTVIQDKSNSNCYCL